MLKSSRSAEWQMRHKPREASRSTAMARQEGRDRRPGEPGSALWARAGAGAVGFARGASQAELDFEPARQTVTAQVEARFAMTVPAS